ncbi:MAG: conjugative transposon protein TraM [Terrimonas sp.]|nr:conjugative transposon protein TraM [Terrimonas sp.]OJY92180.1 MAG: conjugative transposon protein TraM [Sphingobacteriales bacterium 40-81]
MENGSEEKPQHSAKFLRKRKFLMVAPLLVLPFIILLLWTLGLVGEVKEKTPGQTAFRGLNLNLPSAAPAKDSNWNKLKYYEQADKDSAKLESRLKNARFFDEVAEDEDNNEADDLSEDGYARPLYDPAGVTYKTDRNEQKVYQKLASLQQELNKEPKHGDTVSARRTVSNNPDIDRLEGMMQEMTRDTGPDTQLTQLNDMLTKILDIQNPERVQEKLRQQSEQNKKQVFAVQAPPDNFISILESRQEYTAQWSRYHNDSLPEALRTFITSNRFYSLEDVAVETTAHRSIPASIPENQTLVSGATLKLRLLEDIYVAGVKIPKDHYVYGMVTLNGERLQISISSIEYQNYVLPVSLTVYDKKDGLQGIHIPGAITRDVAKRSAAQSVQRLGTLNMLDPSIGAQAVSAGLQMAQNLVSKSAKMVWVTVEEGYPVLLKDDNQKDK